MERPGPDGLYSGPKAAGMMLLPRRRQSDVPDVPAGGATAGASVGNLPGSLDPFDPTRLT